MQKQEFGVTGDLTTCTCNNLISNSCLQLWRTQPSILKLLVKTSHVSNSCSGTTSEDIVLKSYAYCFNSMGYVLVLHICR